jgi:hypothetical protein
MLGAQGLWAGRDLYRATPAVTRGLGFSGLIRWSTPISRLLRHTRGFGGSILTRILTGEIIPEREKNCRKCNGAADATTSSSSSAASSLTPQKLAPHHCCLSSTKYISNQPKTNMTTFHILKRQTSKWTIARPLAWMEFPPNCAKCSIKT